MTRHLVTGATGLVGAGIILELLAQTDDTVLALVRGKDTETARQRLHANLIADAETFGTPELVEEIRRRVEAVPGDILTPGAGVADPASLGRVDQVWHSAASLKYGDQDAEEIAACNVDGTRNVLDLAETIGADTLNYISTAYVAGSRTGRVLETIALPDTPVNNQYEASKVRAELMVDATAGMHTRIMRPTIVIGHSTAIALRSDAGMYGLHINAAIYRLRVWRQMGDYLAFYESQIFADPQTRVNLVPVDIVARNAVRIGTSNTDARIFHLANAATIPVMDVIGASFGLLGMQEPKPVQTREKFSLLDRKLDEGMDFYSSYMRYYKEFDRTNTDAVCGEQASRWECDRETIERYLTWFMTKGMGARRKKLWPTPATDRALSGA